jgi:hypothetical protein
MKKTMIISIDIDTEKSIKEIQIALKKGVFYGLDVKNVASPLKVRINYCQER